MVPSLLNLRLQQLENNINQVLQLLNDYETELIDEDEPSRKSKYRRRVESLKKQKSIYEEEFSELQTQLISECPIQTQAISNQLQEIDDKIELLLDSQASLSQALMSYFCPQEQELILPFIKQLNKPELMNVQAFLEAVETDKASEEEVQKMLTETRSFLERLQGHNLVLPVPEATVFEIINSPTIDAKHALKVSIPIIPFILAYEGELSLGTGINLKETWQYWKSKFYK